MHNATGQAANRLPSLSLELGFLNGTVGVFSGGQVRPRKWGCGVHAFTLARDGSQKKPHDGLLDTSVLPNREHRAWPTAPLTDLNIGGRIGRCEGQTSLKSGKACGKLAKRLIF